MKIAHIQPPHIREVQVKNRKLLQWLTVIVALWSVLFKPINILPGPLSYLKYLPDGVLLVMLILCLSKKHHAIGRDLYLQLRTVLILFAYCLIVYLLQYQSVAYFLWGFRNIFRFYVAFFVFVTYLDEIDASTWLKIMDVLFWINAALSVFQFFVMGLYGDYLGGIFGVLGASNGFSMCFMSIVIGKSLVDSFEGYKPISNSMVKCFTAIIVAAMAELKFFFFIMIFLFLAAAIMTRFSLKKTIMLILGMFALMLGSLLLVEWFSSYNFFSLNGLWEYATSENYSSKGDVNRLSAIPSLIKRLDIPVLQQIFGMGLGNCDTSTFSICNSHFYRQYGYLHYTWFTSAMVFLEMGFVGLAIYISFFLSCFWYAYKNFKAKTGNRIYNQLAIMISILCIILTTYNSSLRIESAYMMYFVLALPFISNKKKKALEA